MPFKVTTAPAAEPLLLSDPIVKAQFLRIIDSSEDASIAMLLGKCREAAEKACWRALITQTITMAMDKFPSPSMETSSANWYGPSWGVGPGPLTVTRPDGITGYEIYCPRAPLQSVTSIKYWDQDGTQQTLSPSAYLVDTYSEPGRIVPAPGTAWPATQNRINAVEVAFVAGYGADGSFVPMGIKHWMLVMTSTLLENRELVAILNRGTIQELPYVNQFLQDYAVKTFNPPSYWS